MKCLCCSVNFLPDLRHPKQKFCSHKCYTKSWARNKRGWKPVEKTLCVVCRMIFLPPGTRPHSQTCSKKCSQRLHYHKQKSHYIERAKQYALNNREKINAYLRSYRQRHPLQTYARRCVWAALISGKLFRPSACSKCSITCKPEAHHHLGYYRPLEVIWLCKSCHVSSHPRH